MKKVGIVIRDFWENDKEFVGCRTDVLDSFFKYPVNIILIPIYFDFGKVLELVSLCDGIVLTGGDHYLENDFLLVHYLYQQDIPTLGICLGMQVMALAFGDGEEMDIFNHNLKNNDTHDIIIYKNTFLHKIIGNDVTSVNSRHNTVITSTDLSVSARSFDGVIEAVEDAKKRFFIGLEWHPESFKNKNSDLIWEAFIKSL